MTKYFSPADKIEIARLDLLIAEQGRWVFFGHLTLALTPRPNPQLHTFCSTDGDFLYYNPDFIEQCTIEQVCGLVAHETLHCAFGHMRGHRLNRTGDRDSEIWNLACDIIVNEIVTSNGLQLPQTIGDQKIQMATVDSIPLDPPLEKYVLEYTAEQLYNRIPKQGGGGDDGSQAPRGCGLLDPNAGSGGDSDAEYPTQSQEQAQRWMARAKAAEAKARDAGHAPAGIEEILKELFKPRVDWKRVLHRFIQKVNLDESYIPPDRRVWALRKILDSRIVLPSISEGEVITDLVLAVDTSGSISHEELVEFCSEVYGIAMIGVNMHLVFCDAAIQEWKDLEPRPKIPVAKGRGGTSFHPVFEEIKRRNLNIQALVYFTDGFPNDGWPKQPPYPVIWVVNNDQGLHSAEVQAPYGQRVRYPKMEERYD